jgi:hypothetical protein
MRFSPSLNMMTWNDMAIKMKFNVLDEILDSNEIDLVDEERPFYTTL